ncbi:MAG TPA: AAA family ATPase [Longimicrobium sp.]|jgi:predicted ATPase
MIDSLRFTNFKVLRTTELGLGRYNLVVGPNGSGKSTLFDGLRLLAGQGLQLSDWFRSAGIPRGSGVGVTAEWKGARIGYNAVQGGSFKRISNLSSAVEQEAWDVIGRTRIFSFNPERIAAPVQLKPAMQLESDGSGLAGVLDRMRDEFPETFEGLNEDISRLMPEFDRILFDTPGEGMRAFALRTREGQHKIRATELSHGVLLAIALLTLSYLPKPPSIIGLEEPDRGIHPRLYRDVQDALYRLSYPESFGMQRKPAQVIVTTHSPLLLDLHKDHPEEIIIAEKTELGSEFHRLSERPDLAELLEEVSLGEAWYSGILGGVPVAP